MSENLATSGPSVDTHAPDLTLSTVSSLERRISHGEPRVLAFLQHGLGHEPPRELAAIRAELRGLGAELLVISPHGIWSVRADDPLQAVTPAGGGPAGDARITDAVQTAERYGVASGSDAVIVIDGRGIVRFTHRLEGATGAVWTKLASALAIAGRAMLVRDRHDAKQRVLFTRREWTLTSLVVGCATAFLGGCNEARKDQHQRPDERRSPPPADAAPPEVDVALTIDAIANAVCHATGKRLRDLPITLDKLL